MTTYGEWEKTDQPEYPINKYELQKDHKEDDRADGTRAEIIVDGGIVSQATVCKSQLQGRRRTSIKRKIGISKGVIIKK